MPFFSLARKSDSDTVANDKPGAIDALNTNDSKLAQKDQGKDGVKNSQNSKSNKPLPNSVEAGAPDRLVYDEEKGWITQPNTSKNLDLKTKVEEKDTKNKGDKKENSDILPKNRGILKKSTNQNSTIPKEDSILPLLNINSNSKVKMTKVFHFADVDPSKNHEFVEPPTEEKVDLPDLPACQCEGCRTKKYKILNPYLLSNPPENKTPQMAIVKAVENKGKVEKNVQTDNYERRLVPYRRITPVCMCLMCQEQRRWDNYYDDRCSLCDESECSLCETNDYCDYCSNSSPSKHHNCCGCSNNHHKQYKIIKRPVVKTVVKAEQPKEEKKEEKKDEKKVEPLSKPSLPSKKGFLIKDPKNRVAKKTVLTKLKTDYDKNIPSVVISFL